MQITNIELFLNYFEKIRSRTLRIIDCIPPDKIEWTYKEGKFTFGDLIRHLATIERYMYAENAQFKPSSYPGCGEELASGYEATLQYLHDMHQESVAIFSKLTPEDLNKKCITPGGIPITLWKWLRAMVEHEVHHRGQFYTYLGMLEIDVPPLYGLTSEEVLERSKTSS
ncbi:MAG: DinB family protein [Bacteroidota bacterium]